MHLPYILISEDDADDRFLLESAFSEKKYPEKIEFVQNGVELLKYLHSVEGNSLNGGYPMLILLDLNMPRKDGREALQEIKLKAELKRIPIFIFTTNPNEKEISRCYELGADRYVVKPVTYDGLLDFVDEIHEFCSSIRSRGFKV